MNEETKKLERKLGWIVEYPHCVFITLIRGNRCTNCNLCNHDFYSVCTLGDYTRTFSKWLDKKNILKYTKSMRNVLPKTVRKDYIKSVTTHADMWCERCHGQRLVFGRIKNIIDELMSCEDCDLCFPIKQYSVNMFKNSCMFRFDTLSMILR